MRTAITAVAASSLLAIAGAADASISLRFNGFGNNMDVRIFLYDHSDITPTNLLYGELTGTAGYYRYQGADTNPTQFAGHFGGFCMEPMTGTSSFNLYHPFDVVSPSIAPDPGTPIPGPDGMGPDRAAQIERAVYAAYEPHGGISNWDSLSPLEAAGLNLAIWEIIYERGDVALDATNGFIRFEEYVITTGVASLEEQANLYIAAALDPDAPRAEGLLAITSNEYQDFLIPTPGAVSLAATAGILGLRRRRR